MTTPPPRRRFTVAGALNHIAQDAVKRTDRASRMPGARQLAKLWAAANTIKGAQADGGAPMALDGQKGFNFTWPENVTDVQKDAADFVLSRADLLGWGDIGREIRAGGTRACVSKLAYILENLSQIASGQYSSAASALSLLPTAGALITAPTKEMWVLLKLIPMAGILSMFLSLGGSIMPTDVRDYDLNKPFTYGGMIAQRERADAFERAQEEKTLLEDANNVQSTRASRFASLVRTRTLTHTGNGRSMWIGLGMGLQAWLISGMLVAMYFAQSGAIIPWMCEISWWIYLWYFLVVFSCIFDSVFAAPFHTTWTLRISRLPKHLEGVDNCPSVVVDARGAPMSALDAVRHGINQRIWVRVNDVGGNFVPHRCFYVLISSQSGISRMNALMRCVSRALTVALFAFGTVLFASCQLMVVSGALLVLSVVLGCGILGRVVAMWLVYQLQGGDDGESTILHALVKDQAEAADYIQEIVQLPGCLVELQGHVIVEGHCIYRGPGAWQRLETYIGILQRPFDIARKSIRRPTFRQSAGPPGGHYSVQGSLLGADEERGLRLAKPEGYVAYQAAPSFSESPSRQE